MSSAAKPAKPEVKKMGAEVITDAKAFLKKVNGSKGKIFSVKCHSCGKVLKKAGLTVFKYYTKTNEAGKQAPFAVSKVLSCNHLSWDGEPGCCCCCTIRDGKICCADCCGWDVLSGTVVSEMKTHEFTWENGEVTKYVNPNKKKPKQVTNKRKIAEVRNVALVSEVNKLNQELKKMKADVAALRKLLLG